MRSVCLVAVLDRAGVRPIDYDPTVDKASERPRFDPSLYSSEELDLIERVLRLMVDRAGGQEGVGAIGNGGDQNLGTRAAANHSFGIRAAGGEKLEPAEVMPAELADCDFHGAKRTFSAASSQNAGRKGRASN